MNSTVDNQPVSGKNAVIIVAAGRGSRMGDSEGGLKQYRKMGNFTVLQQTVNAFAASSLIDLIQVVIHKDDSDLYAQSLKRNPKLLAPVIGGETRQQSAFEGLKAVSGTPINNVLIHDAARPFIEEALIETVLAAIEPNCCSLPAIAVADTIKRASSRDNALWVNDTVSREELYLAQTPQGFVFDDILIAHQAAETAGNFAYTDDAAVGEASGMKVKLVQGNRRNFKITTPNDLIYANEINMLSQFIKVPDVRTGNGYDVHRLVPGEKIILCGVEIPFNRKLDGHSDADVGLHALTDALLGTIGDGDIGSHFPPTDPKWRGAASDQFLAHACKLVRARGGVITHMDVSLICEFPKIGPHRENMRQKIASICAMDVDRIAVKATTNETIGSIGRGEGIASIATATVVMKS